MNTETYDSLSEFYAEHRTWKALRGFYKNLNIPEPPEPVWMPSEKYQESMKGFEIE